VRVVQSHSGAEIVGYVSIDRKELEQKVQEFGDPEASCFIDFGQALEETKPDAVILATPPEGHYRQVLLAFEKGVHVLVEKPLTEKLEDAVMLADAADRRGLQLMVGMNFRYLPAHQVLKQFIQEKRLGEPAFGQFAYIRHRDGRRQDLNKYCLNMEQPMLLEQSIHHLDLMRYCYNREVEAVVAQTWNPSWSTYQDDSNVSILLQFEEGLCVNYLGTWTAAWNKFDFQWRTDCSRGMLLQKGQFGNLCLARFQPDLAQTGDRFKDEAEPLQPLQMESVQAFIDDTALMFSRFVEALRLDRPVETSGRDHLRSLALVFACIESARNRKWVEMEWLHQKYNIGV
jgi:predicted dehydrogenase